jgi:hypothetical protein
MPSVHGEKIDLTNTPPKNDGKAKTTTDKEIKTPMVIGRWKTQGL